MLGNIIFNHWTQQSVRILHTDGHGNTCKQPSVSINPGCVHRINSALGEQWEQRSHLVGCMPPQKTELTQIVSWRALASSSLCTLPKLLGRLLCANLWEHINIVKLQHKKESTRHFKLSGSMGTWLPDLKRSSRVLAARDLLCLEPGRTAWEEAWILLSICREGSTPAQRQDQSRERTVYNRTETKIISSFNARKQKYQCSSLFAECALEMEQRCWISTRSSIHKLNGNPYLGCFLLIQ